MAMNAINRTFPDILRRAGVHQTTAALPWVAPQYRNTAVNSAGVANTYAFPSPGARLKAFEIHNRSDSAINCGIGFRWANHCWEAGRYDGTTYTRLTDLQTTTAVAIQVTGADQTGFVVLSDRQFDWVSGDVTTAETDDDGGGAEVDHVVQYSNAAGTGWTTVVAASTFVDSWTTANAVWSASAHNFVWAPPSDWGKNVSLTGLPAGFYALHFQSAQRAANDVAALVSGMEIGSMWSIDTLANNGIWEEEKADYDDPYANALVALFATAGAGNRVIATIETR